MKERAMVSKFFIPAIEEFLPSRLLLRIHRSFIVAICKTDSFKLSLSSEYGFRVSRSYRHPVEKVLIRLRMSKYKLYNSFFLKLAGLGNWLPVVIICA